MILHTKGRSSGFRGNVVGRITHTPIHESPRRKDHVLAVDKLDEADACGYAGLMTRSELDDQTLGRLLEQRIPVVHAIKMLDIFEPGQVVVMEGRTGFVRIVFRPGSRFNYILTTDRCNSRCLMCSQPPRDIDDSGRIHDHLRLVELMDPGVPYLGITGGEPTLLKDDLLRLIARCRDCLPRTHVHMLTNGRLFYYEGFARKLAEVGHPSLTLGIPLYSDIDHEHDYVVQAEGAFVQTALGFYNLARHLVNVEIRIVIHKLTYRRLSELAEYTYRHFPFACHIALMGLELTGYTKANLGLLWIDPFDYQNELERAVNFLANRGMRVSIYNHQLCVLRRSLWPYARQAISDWKNEYIQECNGCLLRDKCGGFFASGMRLHSAHIRPFKSAELRRHVTAINSQ